MPDRVPMKRTLFLPGLGLGIVFILAGIGYCIPVMGAGAHSGYSGMIDPGYVIKPYLLNGFGRAGMDSGDDLFASEISGRELPTRSPGTGGSAGNPVPEPSTLLLLAMGFFTYVFQASRAIYCKFRRFLDITISTAALLILSPLLAAVGLLIKFNSPGPVFYKQVRVGLNRRKKSNPPVPALMEKRQQNNFGKPFTIIKFRTMCINAEAGTGAVWARKNDPRITPLGKLLRLFRIDEIPQCINILKGDMSLIGPRPERPEFVRELNENLHSYSRRYNVRPGITGLAQVHYRYAASLKDTRNKLKYDLLYIRERSFLMDAWICASTMVTVMFAKGAR